MSLIITNLTDVLVNESFLKNLGQKIWQVLDLPKRKKVSLVFVGVSQIKKINLCYRQKNQITDILSFNYQTKKDNHFFIQEPNFLGEIVICLTQVQKQARQKKHSWQTELTHILIHGILHLIGYDHQSQAGRQKMELKTEGILLKLQSKS